MISHFHGSTTHLCHFTSKFHEEKEKRHLIATIQWPEQSESCLSSTKILLYLLANQTKPSTIRQEQSLLNSHASVFKAMTQVVPCKIHSNYHTIPPVTGRSEMCVEEIMGEGAG